MVDVIVLCAGASSRFPNSRPKWLLTHPNGKRLFERALEGLQGAHEEHILVLREHLVEYQITPAEITQLTGAKCWVLEGRTSSQADSAMAAVLMVQPKGAIFFKDCDSYFEHEVLPENCVVTSRVVKEAPLDFGAKCFIQSDNVGRIQNIVEKKIISNEFAIGGYGFENRDIFQHAFSTHPKGSHETFLSHLVLAAMAMEHIFAARPGGGYEDYGTAEAFRAEVSKYGTIFVDLDGTLLKSTGALGAKKWGSGEIIPGNISEVRRLHDSGRYTIIITTARPESLRLETVAELNKHGVPHHRLIMGLSNAPRLIINDRGVHSPTMAEAVEIERDSDTLGRELSFLK